MKVKWVLLNVLVSAAILSSSPADADSRSLTVQVSCSIAPSQDQLSEDLRSQQDGAKTKFYNFVAL